MYVFELEQPGEWLDDLNDGSRRDAEALLRLLSTCIQDAAIALSMFEQSRDAMLTSVQADRTGERGAALERAAEERLVSVLTPSSLSGDGFLAMDRIRDLARQEVRREKWRSGEMPRDYLHRIPFLHAKTFVYALDTLHKALERLACIPEVPQAVTDILQAYRLAFPNLLAVRDSSHHVEDRVQGKRRNAKLELKPVTNDLISAPTGGALFVDMLNGSRYGGTLADGSYGEVDVSAEPLASAHACVQEVLNTFKWRGPAMHLPS